MPLAHPCCYAFFVPPRLLRNGTLARTGGWAGVLALTLSLAACSPSPSSKQGSSAPSPGTHTSIRAQEHQRAAYAKRLDAIPPPSKPRYLAVSTSSRWQNPFLTIHKDSVELRVPAPGVRSRHGARRSRRRGPLWKTTKLSVDALPAALAALPENNWPYGRVIAIRDDLSGPPSARVQVRRNEEKILNLLNNLGVVAYEWPRNKR